MIAVKVEQQHIDSGERFSRMDCPLAKAVCAATGRRVQVGGLGVSIADLWIPLPEEAVRFIDRFDDCSSVEPFEFDLDLEVEAC